MTNWNDKTITASDWDFNCQCVERERIEKDAYIEASWDCNQTNRYDISVLLTYSTSANDYEWLFNVNTDEYPNLDIFHIWNECVKGATEIAEKYGIELIIDEPIKRFE